MVYRSKFTINSIHETTAFNQLRSASLLPDDAWSKSVDDGHNIAFFSNDLVSCAIIDNEVQMMHNRLTAELRKNYTQNTGYEDADWIEANYFAVILPNAEEQFRGWEICGK
jgi:hypothetical protein